MKKAIEVFNPDRDKDRDRLKEMKKLENKFKKKLKRVEILHGHAFSLNVSKWEGHHHAIKKT